MELREVTYLAVVLRIVAATLVGGFIGLERELKNRPAGLRTYMLVCVGSCIVMLTNQYITQTAGAGDPVRMGAQVVSGIGFLGAGTIIVTRRNQIKGLTTAAGLWAAAGVGLALGAGFYEAALVGGLCIFVIITGFQKMDSRMHRKSRQVEVYVELKGSKSLGEVLRDIRARDLDVSNVQQENTELNEQGIRAYIATVKAKNKLSHVEIMDEIRSVPGVYALEEL